MIALMFDMIERTLWLCEVAESEIGDGDEPVGAQTLCYFETWSEAARALEAATKQAQYQLLLRSDQNHTPDARG